MYLQFEVEAKELELSRLLGEEEVDTKATKEVCLARLVCFVETFESVCFARCLRRHIALDAILRNCCHVCWVLTCRSDGSSPSGMV